MRCAIVRTAAVRTAKKQQSHQQTPKIVKKDMKVIYLNWIRKITNLVAFGKNLS